MGSSKKIEEKYRGPAQLQYGAGLRLNELVSLRVKDLNLERELLTVRGGKGDSDRVTVIPECLHEALKGQLALSRSLWEKDRAENRAGVAIPGGLGRKFSRAGKSWEWHRGFPAAQLSRNPENGEVRRYHLHGKVYAEAMKRAAQNAGIEKRVTTHALRHAFATHLLERGTDI